jgi:hypothetical protein
MKDRAIYAGFQSELEKIAFSVSGSVGILSPALVGAGVGAGVGAAGGAALSGKRRPYESTEQYLKRVGTSAILGGAAGGGIGFGGAKLLKAAPTTPVPQAVPPAGAAPSPIAPAIAPAPKPAAPAPPPVDFAQGNQELADLTSKFNSKQINLGDFEAAVSKARGVGGTDPKALTEADTLIAGGKKELEAAETAARKAEDDTLKNVGATSTERLEAAKKKGPDALEEVQSTVAGRPPPAPKPEAPPVAAQPKVEPPEITQVQGGPPQAPSQTGNLSDMSPAKVDAESLQGAPAQGLDARISGGIEGLDTGSMSVADGNKLLQQVKSEVDAGDFRQMPVIRELKKSLRGASDRNYDNQLLSYQQGSNAFPDLEPSHHINRISSLVGAKDVTPKQWFENTFKNIDEGMAIKVHQQMSDSLSNDKMYEVISGAGRGKGAQFIEAMDDIAGAYTAKYGKTSPWADRVLRHAMHLGEKGASPKSRYNPNGSAVIATSMENRTTIQRLDNYMEDGLFPDRESMVNAELAQDGLVSRALGVNIRDPSAHIPGGWEQRTYDVIPAFKGGEYHGASGGLGDTGLVSAFRLKNFTRRGGKAQARMQNMLLRGDMDGKGFITRFLPGSSMSQSPHQSPVMAKAEKDIEAIISRYLKEGKGDPGVPIEMIEEIGEVRTNMYGDLLGGLSRTDNDFEKVGLNTLVQSLEEGGILTSDQIAHITGRALSKTSHLSQRAVNRLVQEKLLQQYKSRQ